MEIRGETPRINVVSFGARARAGFDNASSVLRAKQYRDDNGGVLYFPPGSFEFGSNVTLSGALEFADGGILKPRNGVTLTVSGTFTAEDVRLFDVSLGGVISFTGTDRTEVRATWFGSTADPLALAAAYAAANTNNMRVYLSAIDGAVFQASVDAQSKANAAQAAAIAAAATDATTKANAAQAAAIAAAATDASTKSSSAQAAAIAAAAADATTKANAAQLASLPRDGSAAMTGPLVATAIRGPVYDRSGGEINALHPDFGATYNGNGDVTNGSAVLNAFFAALTSASGKTRKGVIPGRKYICTSTVSFLPSNRVYVRTNGATIVPQGDFANTPVLLLGDTTGAARLNHAELLGLDIDPSSGTGASNIREGVALGAVHNSKIGVMVANIPGDGWGLYQAGYNNDMMHCEAYQCTGRGLVDYTDSDADPLLNFTPTKWWGGRFEDNYKSGVVWRSPGGWFFGTTFQSNGRLNTSGSSIYYDLHVLGQGAVDAHSCQFETFGPVTRAKKTLIRVDTTRSLRMFGGYILSDTEGLTDKTLANQGIEISDPNCQEISLSGVKFYGLGIPWHTSGKAISVLHPQYTACLTTNPDDMAPRATCTNFVHLGGQLVPILRGPEVWLEGALTNFTSGKGIEVSDTIGIKSTATGVTTAGLSFPNGSLDIIDVNASGKGTFGGDVSGVKGTFTGDISALGGYRQFIDGWFHNAVIANMALVKAVRASWSGVSPEVVRMIRAGSITGLNVEVDAAITAGSMTVTYYYFRSGNFATAATVTFGVGNFPNGKPLTFAKDAITFNANELVWPMISTTADFAGPTRVRMALEVET